MDGLTAISDAGMTDWFGDNIQKANKIIGSYDQDKSNYNITLLTEQSIISARENDKNNTIWKSDSVHSLWTSILLITMNGHLTFLEWTVIIAVLIYIIMEVKVYG